MPDEVGRDGDEDTDAQKVEEKGEEDEGDGAAIGQDGDPYCRRIARRVLGLNGNLSSRTIPHPFVRF